MPSALSAVMSKLPEVGVTIFTVMTRQAVEHGAINLAQGFPDFDCDPALVAAVHAHMKQGNNQYAPMQGVLALREAIAGKIAAQYGATYDPATEITITSGATEALFCAIATRLCRVRARTNQLRGPRDLLSGQARPLPRADRRLAVQAHPVPWHLLPTPRPRGHHP